MPPVEMPVTLGFHCSHEQHAPSALLQLARRAEEAGFRAAMCSDHFHRWSEAQGHSGFIWSWLEAALQSTAMSFGTVCAPGQRYHAAVVAQAAATLAEMYAGRFWVALGSGEALNEAITGAPWPSKATRQARLGFAPVYVHNVVRDEQQRLLDACTERLLPALAGDPAPVGRAPGGPARSG